MKKYIFITKQTFSLIKSSFFQLIKNQQGAIFPYLLSIMLLMSSFLLVSLDTERFQFEQLNLLEEQQIIQNLIQISIHDFNSITDQLQIQTEVQTIDFTYETGKTTVNYRLIDENTVHLRIHVYTESNLIDPFIHSVTIHV